MYTHIHTQLCVASWRTPTCRRPSRPRRGPGCFIDFVVFLFIRFGLFRLYLLFSLYFLFKLLAKGRVLDVLRDEPLHNIVLSCSYFNIESHL